MIRSNTKIFIIKNGIIAFEIFSIGKPLIPDAIYKQDPTGGVISPIIRLKQRKTPM